MKKLTGILGIIFIGILNSEAQTIRAVAAGSINSTTLGGNNSINIGIGSGNLLSTNTGASNVFIGSQSGSTNTTGTKNTFLGNTSGVTNISGSNNTFIGFGSGMTSKGNSNICIGTNSGGFSSDPVTSNQLFIDIVRSDNPLIWGNFDTDQVKLNCKVGIGAVTTFPATVGGIPIANYRLFVTGGVLADEVRVALNANGTWADYVFANDYKLRPLSEVEEFISKNNHLPNVPSANQIKIEGINVAEMARIHQEKIEELTLYIIQQNKRIEALELKINAK